MKKPRLMILGASYTQIPLYQAARALGCEVTAASIPGDYPCFSLAEDSALVDIADPEAVLKAAKDRRIDGIATCGLDLGMRSIGRVCSQMHLPGPSQEAALRASNKLLMKAALVAAGVQTAPFRRIDSEEDLKRALAEFSFPVILKAVDQMGSRGIFRCGSEEEVYRNYPLTMAATKQSYCLLEEFLTGEIFGVEAMMQQGKLVYHLPNNIAPFYGSTVSPLGHSVPYRYLDALGGQIEEQTCKAIAAIGLDNCPVNLDFIRQGDRVFVVELTGRSGATGLSEMVGLYYGINYYEMIVRIALGRDVSPFFTAARGEKAVIAQTLTAPAKGKVKAIHVPDGDDPQVREVSFNIRPGDAVRKYTNGRDRIGQVIVTGDSEEDCRRRFERVMDAIRVDVEEGC